MDWDDYLQDEARKYRKLAEPKIALSSKKLLELAQICDNVANALKIA